MPTRVDDYALSRAKEGILRALRSIDKAHGYNTTPKVQMGAMLVHEVPDTNFPQIAVEMGDLEVAQEKYGGACQGTIRYEWPAMVWGYVKTSQGDDALYRAGLALLSDIQAAIYADETLPDGAGQGTVLMAEPGSIPFDMESFSSDGKGYLVVEFRLVVDLTRGANP